MDRRSFLTAGMAIALLPISATATTATFLNGELNRQKGTFDWTGGGNDPLQSAWTNNRFKQTFAIPRLNLDTATQKGLMNQMKSAPQRFSLTALKEGKVAGDVMVSGNGWIALRPRVLTRRWKKGRSVQASWWAWTNQSTGERWEIIVPDVCNNLILTRLGQAVPCQCESGDACV
jgi:hypothetical protein